MAKRKDRKVSDTDRAFYKLGFENCRAAMEVKLLVKESVIKAQMAEIKRKDGMNPINGVVVSFEVMEWLIKYLRKKKLKYWQRRCEKLYRQSMIRVSEL